MEDALAASALALTGADVKGCTAPTVLAASEKAKFRKLRGLAELVLDLLTSFAVELLPLFLLHVAARRLDWSFFSLRFR